MVPALYSRYRSVLSLLLLSLALSGCRMLGMRDIPLHMLEEWYESPESRYETVDGTKIHYRIEGNRKGPTLVLLHGVMASLHTWDGWVDQLSQDYRIIRMDIPGFGLSEPLASGDYTPEYAVEFFEKAREKLGLEKFHLAGNSLGGFISWYYATKYPQHVDKLILIDPVAYTQKLPRIIKFASGGFGGFMAKISSPRFLVKKNIKQVYGNPRVVTEEIVDRYHDLLLREGHRESMVEYFRVLKKYSTDESIGAQVKKLSVPTLLMWGEEDRWVPPELISRWRQDVDGLQVKTYAGGGHIPMEEFPEETARDAHAFLSDGATSVASRSSGKASGSEVPEWGDEAGDTATAQEPEAEETEAEETAPAPAPKKKPAAKGDENMVGWGEFGEM